MHSIYPWLTPLPAPLPGQNSTPPQPPRLLQPPREEVWYTLPNRERASGVSTSDGRAGPYPRPPCAIKWDHGKHVHRRRSIYTGSWLLTSMVGGWPPPRLSCCCCCCCWAGVETSPLPSCLGGFLGFRPQFSEFLLFWTIQGNRTSLLRFKLSNYKWAMNILKTLKLLDHQS